jgi:hypothetical protein
MSPTQQPYHFLMVDDSEVVQNRFCESLAFACHKYNQAVLIIRGNKQGRFFITFDSLQPQNGVIPVEQGFNPNILSKYNFVLYTAYMPRLAMPIFNLPFFDKLTILSDISMPSDTEVGILGMMETLSRKRLPTNLIFASSEYQNRNIIEGLINKGKAYFVEKGTQAWENLPFALVTRANTFTYQVFIGEDIGGKAQYAKAIPSPVVPPTTNSKIDAITARKAVALSTEELLGTGQKASATGILDTVRIAKRVTGRLGLFGRLLGRKK